MHLEIPINRAFVYPAPDGCMRFIYRDRSGRVRSQVAVVPAHLRGPFGQLASVAIDTSGRVPYVQVPVLTPAHKVRGPTMGQIDQALQQGGVPDQVRIERLVLR